jgi:regulator of Ty1 transposition protein 103
MFYVFFTASNNRKLTFMYLANDVIQNSKKKGPEFGAEFEGILKKAYEHMGSWHPDPKTRQGLNRILQVWQEREVYDAKKINEWRKALGKHKEGIRKIQGLEPVLETLKN